MNISYQSSEFLWLRFQFESNECVFCEDDTETAQRLFATCPQTQLFIYGFVKKKKKTQ